MKEDIWYLKERKNRRIKICGGCKAGFNDIKPPNNICLVTLRERLLRGEKAPFGKTKLVPTHFHTDKRCLRGKGFNIKKVDFGNVNLSEEDMKILEKNGIYPVKSKKNLLLLFLRECYKKKYTM